MLNVFRINLIVSGLILSLVCSVGVIVLVGLMFVMLMTR